MQMAADGDRGQVLDVKETTGFRSGGVTLPARGDGMPVDKIDSAPTMSFYGEEASARIRPALRLDSSDGKSGLGVLPSVPRTQSSSVRCQAPLLKVQFPFLADGKWHQILVDLRPIAKLVNRACDRRRTRAARSNPRQTAKLAGRLQPDPVDYFFDEFKFTTESAGTFHHRRHHSPTRVLTMLKREPCLQLRPRALVPTWPHFSKIRAAWSA